MYHSEVSLSIEETHHILPSTPLYKLIVHCAYLTIYIQMDVTTMCEVSYDKQT